jgi:hypothetical protein
VRPARWRIGFARESIGTVAVSIDFAWDGIALVPLLHGGALLVIGRVPLRIRAAGRPSVLDPEPIVLVQERIGLAPVAIAFVPRPLARNR